MDRIDIESCSRRNAEDHIERYVFARKFVKGKKVLDIACGTGYGTQMMLEAGADVLGVDISEDVIAENKQKYGDHFMVGDIVDFSHDTFDIIVCFETIEHVDDFRMALMNLHKLLKPCGTLIISSPNRRITEPLIGKPTVDFHVREFTPDELKRELTHRFTIKGCYAQRLQPKIPCKLLRTLYGKIFRPQHNASPEVKEVGSKEGRYFILLTNSRAEPIIF